MNWRVVYAKHAQKDAKKLAAAGLKAKAQDLLNVLAADPFQNPPPYEKLVGDLVGANGWCVCFVCGRITSKRPFGF